MTIGQKLSEKRRELGKTIKDVEAVLKISSRYLEAMESDNFDKLPSPTYARAFLSDYATYLGLDKEEILEEYEALYLSHPEGEKFVKPRFFFPEWSGTVLILVFLVTLFSFSLYYLFSYYKTEAPRKKPRIESKTSPPEKTLPSEPTLPTRTITPAETTIEPSSPKVILKVRITGKESWIRVIVDGEKVYEGTMKQGEESKWEGNEIKLRVGNPSSTEVTVDGRIVDLGRTRTGVVEKVFIGGGNE